jgi:hypothetical protein
MELDDKKVRAWAKNNLIRKTNRHYVVCEAVRLVYDDIYNMLDSEVKKRITERLIDIVIMVKNMSNRLHYYRENYNDQTGKSGQGFRVLSDNQARANMRKARQND